MRNDAVKKIRIITALALVGFLSIIVRLYYLQVMHRDEYRAMGESQYVHTVRDLFTRGSIYFTTKEGEKVSAATVKAGYLLAVDPSKLGDLDQTYAALSAITPVDHDTFFERASRRDRTYQEIEQMVEDDAAKKIEALDLPGVRLYRNQWRYYPGKSLSARTIGFVGYDENDLVGKYGLERFYEETLARDTEHLSVNFFAEIFGNLRKLIFDSNEAKQGDIVTTIEPTVARTLDRVLESAQAQWNSKTTGGIIINPMNGEVIALNVVPSFDLNDRTGVELEQFRNPLVEDVYEMGSIVKPLTMASALDAGLVTPTSMYNDPGTIILDGSRISNYDGRARSYVGVQGILSQSLNTGAAYLASLLGHDRFRDYFYKLKLGSETGIDLPNEAHGLVSNLESPRDVEYATASFGQGIAITPIETVRALASLANGGTLITPHLVKRIEYADGTSHDISYPEGERVFSEKTSEDITRMLITVVDTALKAGKAKNEYYTIAAKTGTAQIANPETHKYYADRYLHSFFGYFPAYNPQFLIFLYTVEPKGVQYASETLTDPFLELVQFLINYYALPPDR
jgi:cell division protein FtsI (penicillin-binding protein 3)/stage V sporulation protein D (sporulation-specific penicillin-binding protein)